MELMSKDELIKLDQEFEAEMEREIEKWAKDALEALKEKIRKTHTADEEDIRGVFQVPMGRIGLSEELSDKLKKAGKADGIHNETNFSGWQYDNQDTVSDYENNDKLIHIKSHADLIKICFGNKYLDRDGTLYKDVRIPDRLVYDIRFMAEKRTRIEKHFIFKKKVDYYVLGSRSIVFLEKFSKLCQEEGISLIKVEVCDGYVIVNSRNQIENPLEGDVYSNSTYNLWSETDMIWLYYRVDQ